MDWVRSNSLAIQALLDADDRPEQLTLCRIGPLLQRFSLTLGRWGNPHPMTGRIRWCDSLFREDHGAQLRYWLLCRDAAPLSRTERAARVTPSTDAALRVNP